LKSELFENQIDPSRADAARQVDLAGIEEIPYPFVN
jgi:hypothetical protein